MRAIEKGATYLDKLCHKFYDEPKGCGNKTDYVCRLCGGPLETYYCEERLYLVQCADCGTFSLVKTANPEDAARVTLARPTLTPPNEWVSVEERLPDEELKRFKELFPEENEVEVLVMIQWADTATTLYWDGEKFYDEMRSYEVTHWMPLPAPPDRRPPEGEEDT